MKMGYMDSIMLYMCTSPRPFFDFYKCNRSEPINISPNDFLYKVPSHVRSFNYFCDTTKPRTLDEIIRK